MYFHLARSPPVPFIVGATASDSNVAAIADDVGQEEEHRYMRETLVRQMQRTKLSFKPELLSDVRGEISFAQNTPARGD